MADVPTFRGSFPALVTPFLDDGAIDEKTLRALVDWHVGEGTHGLVPMGTTGESPTVSEAEHERVTEIVVEQVAGRIPVIAGTGSNNTAEAIHYTRHAAAVGADAVLVVVPYYNKPTQDGLYAHFGAVAEAAPDLPVFVYNVPGRTVADIKADTVARLYKDVPNMVGIKDACADLVRVSEHRELCGNDFIMLSGEDATALAFNAHGGTGAISVTANVAPKLCAEFQEACLAGDYGKALIYQDRLFPLHQAIFVEPSPCPVKYAMSIIGKCPETVRMPMQTVSDATRARVDSAMRHAGLIN